MDGEGQRADVGGAEHQPEIWAKHGLDVPLPTLNGPSLFKHTLSIITIDISLFERCIALFGVLKQV